MRVSEERLRQAIATLHEQMQKQPRTSDGGFWHKQRYPYQMWLDGLFMASPFLAHYGKVFEEPAMFDEVLEALLASGRTVTAGASEPGGIGSQGAHGAVSPKTAGSASQYITVHVDDIDTHYERARAAGARIDRGPHDHARDYRVYEALDLEGHRWRFLQWLREPSL